MDKSYYEVRDIINSIRFYLMLSMMCSQSNIYAEDPEFQLKRFLKELKGDEQFNKEKISKYCEIASENLPAEFLSIYHIDRIDRR